MKNWYCINTSPGKETLAESRLKSRHVETFYPKIQIEIEFGHKRKRKADRSLFSGYLFAYTTLDEYQDAAFGVGREILRLLRIGQEPQTIDEIVIDEIKSRVEPDGYILTADQSAARKVLESGQSVRVIEGPFTNLEGLFVRDEKQRIIVLMTFFNTQREVPMPRSYVRPIDYAAIV